MESASSHGNLFCQELLTNSTRYTGENSETNQMQSASKCKKNYKGEHYFLTPCSAMKASGITCKTEVQFLNGLL